MFHSMKFALSIFLVTAAACTGCQSRPGETAQLRGGVEKGPFILGSSVTASVVDAQGNPTGTSYATQTTDQAGSFSLANVPVGGVSFQADGFYYDEVLGGLSTAPITLRSFYAVPSGSPPPAFINVVTHLAHDREKALLGESVPLATAIPQAEGELVTALGIGGSGFTLSAPGASLDEMGGDNDPNAYLFALSAIFVQAAFDAVGVTGPVDAKVQQMLDEVAADLAASGTLAPAATAPLQTAAGEIDVAQVEASFGQYLASIGVSATVPDLTLILSSSTECTAENTLQGSFTITNSLDIANLAPYRCITGDLYVATTGIATVSLPNLRQVSGVLQGTPSGSLDLPVLTTVGGRLDVATPWNLPLLTTTGDLGLSTGPGSTGFDLPALTTAGQVYVGCPAFTAPVLTTVTGFTFESAPSGDVSLPALTTIGTGGITISAGAGNPTFNLDLPALTTSGGSISLGDQTLSAPALQSAAGLLFSGAVSVSLPALTTVGNLAVTGQVSSVSMPALVTQYGYMNVYSTGNLTTLSFPSLTTSAGIGIYGDWNNANTVLTQIDFPALTSAGIVFEAFYNPLLPQCQVTAVDAQLVAHGWTGSYTAYSNGTGTCP